jgi:hypothetical protein
MKCLLGGTVMAMFSATAALSADTSARCPTGTDLLSSGITLTQADGMLIQLTKVDGSTVIDQSKNGKSLRSTYVKQFPSTTECGPENRKFRYAWEIDTLAVPDLALGRIETYRARMTDCGGETFSIDYETAVTFVSVGEVVVGMCKYETQRFDRINRLNGKILSEVSVDWSPQFGWALRSRIKRPDGSVKEFEFVSIEKK